MANKAPTFGEECDQPKIEKVRVWISFHVHWNIFSIFISVMRPRSTKDFWNLGNDEPFKHIIISLRPFKFNMKISKAFAGVSVSISKDRCHCPIFSTVWICRCRFLGYSSWSLASHSTSKWNEADCLENINKLIRISTISNLELIIRIYTWFYDKISVAWCGVLWNDFFKRNIHSGGENFVEIFGKMIHWLWFF